MTPLPRKQQKTDCAAAALAGLPDFNTPAGASGGARRDWDTTLLLHLGLTCCLAHHCAAKQQYARCMHMQELHSALAAGLFNITYNWL
jgi:hypothetical protein